MLHPLKFPIYLGGYRLVELSIIDKVDTAVCLLSLEWVGDLLATPGRLFLGRSYTLEKDPSGDPLLKNREIFPSIGRLIAKIVIVVLFPLSILSTLTGLGLKLLAQKVDPNLSEKYSLPFLIHAREEENFAGVLPSVSIYPNCVSSQENSLWGELYQADPLQIPESMEDPIEELKALLSTVDRQFLKSENLTLVEERDHYLHYIYKVEIISGPLKGVYTDDVDIYYDEEHNCFDIRSASRVGLRDSINVFNFSSPGANKNRIEDLRSALLEI